MSDATLLAACRRATAARDFFETWLFEKVFPLWWREGADHAQGGFFEKIGRDGLVIEEPRRTRVVGRQLYSFATAGSIGWGGPAAEAVAHGLDYFYRCCLKADGTVVSSSRTDGTAVNDAFDLYDHAFALFGLAAAYKFAPDPKLAAAAKRMRDRMREGWAHPDAGFEESVPRILPLKANPHMHVFEACLAWRDALDGGGDQGWLALADEIGHLCMKYFLDPQTGALREFFDGDWGRAAGEDGRIIEPGHQFEWAWLLIRWGRLRENSDAIAAAYRLIDIAETHGVDPARDVAFNEIWDDFTPKNLGARLWPQTERMKAWLLRAETTLDSDERAAAVDKAARAADSLKKYIATDVVGTWRERMNPDGSFLFEPSPASSLYHITCAIAEAHNILPKLTVEQSRTEGSRRLKLM